MESKYYVGRAFNYGNHYILISDYSLEEDFLYGIGFDITDKVFDIDFCDSVTRDTIDQKYKEIRLDTFKNKALKKHELHSKYIIKFLDNNLTPYYRVKSKKLSC